MDFNRSNWIWISDWEKRNTGKPVIAVFKKNFRHADRLKISANCRYKLYINGSFVQEGPQKGTIDAAYLDMADITAFVKGFGDNEALIKVLYYPDEVKNRNDSLYYSPFPCLYVEDLSEGHELDGADGWSVRLADEITIVGESFQPAPIHESEVVSGTDQMNWESAKPYGFFDTRKPNAPFNFENRTIPLMEHHAEKFSDVICLRKTQNEDLHKANDIEEVWEDDESTKITASWRAMLRENVPHTIPANTVQTVEITAGEEMCGYPYLSLLGGKGARVEILYSESYGNPQPDKMTPMGQRPMPPKKGDRLDYRKKTLQGIIDIYNVGGFGTSESPEIYEPYLFRTFRFIRLKIKTTDEALVISSYNYIYTGYPLEVKNHPVSGNEEYNRIWDISLRTLKRCMHETYVDCPFYEQLQYTMDSRAEMLYTYEVSGDDRLPKQAMEAFRLSQRYDGILKASAPTQGVNVIPGFSIFYILMVHDHMRYFGDRELIKHHFGCIENVLGYFDSHLTEKGLVGDVGGILFEHKYWSFIDWCAEWDETIGVPTAKKNGQAALTMESLLYLYGLKKTSEIADFIGRADYSKECLAKAKQLEKAIKDNCINSEGLLTDGPDSDNISTHCQVWAVLCDILSCEQGKNSIAKTYRKEGIPQCSVSMSFYLIGALDKLGVLQEYDSVWDPWRHMLSNNLTTCVENDTDERSDCHAWGAIMLYALPNYYADGLRTQN